MIVKIVGFIEIVRFIKTYYRINYYQRIEKSLRPVYYEHKNTWANIGRTGG